MHQFLNQLLLVKIHRQRERLPLLLVAMIIFMARLKQALDKVSPSVQEQKQQVQPKQLPSVQMLLPQARNQLLLVTIPVQQGIHPLLSVATIGISYEPNKLRQQEINRFMRSFKN